jgi:hypothetical protein
MSYITQAPGATGYVTVYVQAYDGTGALVSGNVQVPALQDITINNSNDVFTWEQLDSGSKLQVATLSTNSIATNIVVDDTTFFGNASATSGSATKLGIFGLSKNKTLVKATLNFGTRTITANAYVTGLSPKITAAQPVWVSPMTLTVTGDFTNT